MTKIHLDTNAYSHYLKGDPRITDILNSADIVFVSVIVIGELLAGFEGGNKAAENKRTLEKFLEKSTVKVDNVTRDTSDIFGLIKSNLKKKGTPIPINDIWIAAQVIESGSILITYDSHFRFIENLRIWDGFPSA